jgi:hypothetical protein
MRQQFSAAVSSLEAAQVGAISPSTRTLGFWSAALATVFSLTYVAGQLAEWAGSMGPGG